MESTLVEKVIRLRERMQFCYNQGGAIDGLRQSLDAQPKLKNNLKIDVSVYLHEDIVNTRFAVPQSLLDIICDHAGAFWYEEFLLAKNELDSL